MELNRAETIIVSEALEVLLLTVPEAEDAAELLERIYEEIAK